MENTKLVNICRQLDFDLAKLHSSLYSTRKNKEKLFVPTEANLAIVYEQLASLKSRIDMLECPTKVFEFIKNHFNDFHSALEMRCDGMKNSPAGYMHFVSGAVTPMILDAEDFTAGCSILIGRFGCVKEVICALEEGCKTEEDKLALADALASFVSRIDHNSPEYTEFYSFLGDEKLNMLLCAVEEAKAFACEKQQQLAGGKTVSYKPLADDDTVKIDLEEYKKALMVNIGVDFDQIIQWYQSETDKTRKECFDIAKSLDIPENNPQTMADINDILLKYAGPAATAEEMYALANSYIKRTRAIAHEYVWLPEDEMCPVCTVPLQLKSGYPWGGYEGGYRFKNPLRGRMFLNNYNVPAITNGWIKINCLHEAYPGHHVQHVRSITDPIPETMKIGAKNVPLHEGTCLRTERAFEFVYAEDPFYPLFVAYRRHHTSVRIKVDLWLRYFGKTIGECVDLYVEELGFDRNTARLQVQAHIGDIGYFTSYYYGMKKLCEWEKLYGYDKKTFTQLLFSVGGVSLENFKLYLDMTEDEKFQLTHRFGSLYQFS